MSGTECPSCGVAYAEHMGLIGTCAEWQRERRATLEAAGAIARYVEEVRRLREALESTLAENTVLIRALERMCSNETDSLWKAKQIGREALQRAGGEE